MKGFYFLMLSLVMSMLLSCNEEETYADQKEREARQINEWLDNNGIDVISMSDFLQDTITDNPDTGPDFSRNEYVLFSDNGVYMQIVRRGEGRMINSGEMWNLNARYVERYIGTGDTMTMNLYQQEPDQFYVQRNGGNYAASFTSGIMLTGYGSSVPNAWIMAFPFIKPGVLNGSPSAKIRLIVPHNQGTQKAASEVYPVFYEIIISKQKYN
jgi:hypothetical protein